MRSRQRVLGLIFCALICGCSQSEPPHFLPSQSSHSTVVIHSSVASEKRDLVEEVEHSVPPAKVLPITFTRSGTILIGLSGATVRLREFFDEDCEYCRQFALSTQPLLEQKYVHTGKLSIELIFFPLAPSGENAAKASLCALQQNAFALFQEQLRGTSDRSEESLVQSAKKIGITPKKMRECMKSDQTAAQLKQHLSLAEKERISRVPTFILGKDRWVGLLPEYELLEKIDAALRLQPRE